MASRMAINTLWYSSQERNWSEQPDKLGFAGWTVVGLSRTGQCLHRHAGKRYEFGPGGTTIQTFEIELIRMPL